MVTSTEEKVAALRCVFLRAVLSGLSTRAVNPSLLMWEEGVFTPQRSLSVVLSNPGDHNRKSGPQLWAWLSWVSLLPEQLAFQLGRIQQARVCGQISCVAKLPTAWDSWAARGWSRLPEEWGDWEGRGRALLQPRGRGQQLGAPGWSPHWPRTSAMDRATGLRVHRPSAPGFLSPHSQTLSSLEPLLLLLRGLAPSPCKSFIPFYDPRGWDLLDQLLTLPSPHPPAGEWCWPQFP